MERNLCHSLNLKVCFERFVGSVQACVWGSRSSSFNTRSDSSLIPRCVLFIYCCFFQPPNKALSCSCAKIITHFDRRYKNAEWFNTPDGVEGSCLPPLWQRQSSKASAGEKPARCNLWISSVKLFSLAHVCKILQKSLQFFSLVCVPDSRWSHSCSILDWKNKGRMFDFQSISWEFFTSYNTLIMIVFNAHIESTLTHVMEKITQIYSRKALGSIPGWGRAFLCGFCMFFPCWRGFPPVSPSCTLGVSPVSTLDRGTGSKSELVPGCCAVAARCSSETFMWPIKYL